MQQSTPAVLYRGAGLLEAGGMSRFGWRVRSFGAGLLVLTAGALVSCKKAPPRGRAEIIQVVPADGEVAPLEDQGSEGDLAAGAQHTLKDGIRVVFDRAAAPEQAVGKVIEGPAFSIEPTLAGQARWLDERTLAFFPAQPLESSRAYQVRLADGVKVAAGLDLAPWKGMRLVFNRIRINFVELDGYREYQPREPVVALRASQVVAAGAAAGCVFVEQRGTGKDKSDGTVTEARAAEADAAPAKTLRITPVRPLAPGTAYVVRCGKEFRPAAGGEGLLPDREERFATYGAPGVVGFKPAGGAGAPAVPADEVTVEVTFATPMPPDQVRAKVSLATAAGAKVPFAVDSESYGTRFRWSGDLTPNTTYALTVKGGLVDRFGQTLPAGVRRHVFRVGDASPRLKMQTGALVVERTPGRLPIATRNLDKIAVACAPVSEPRLAEVLTTVGERGWTSNKAGVDWGKLGLSPRTFDLPPGGARNRWHDGSLALGSACGDDKPSGVYLVEFFTSTELDHERKAKPRWRWTLASVTDLGLFAKVGNASSLVWAVHLGSGQPAPEAAISIRDTAGKVRFSGVTAADGVVAAPAAAALLAAKKSPRVDAAVPSQTDGDEDSDDEESAYRPRRVFVTARLGDDVAVLDTEWNEGLESWHFDVSTDRSRQPTRLRGFLHSDRGLYRPGDTAHLRGLIRSIDGAGRMTTPRRVRSVRLTIEDSRGTRVADVSLPVSGFGSFHHDFVVSAEARLGDFAVKAVADGFTVQDQFSVEEYRPRTFEVQMKAPQKNVFGGRKLVFDVSGNYLYGAPLRAATVNWAVRRRPHRPSFDGFEGFSFQDYASLYDAGAWWARNEDRSFSDAVADGAVTLDANGKTRVTTRDPDKAPPTAMDYVFEATVTDRSGQAVTASSVVVGHRANLYLGVAPADFVQITGKPFVVKTVAFDADGKRRAARARMTLTKRRYDCGNDPGSGLWRCERKEAASPAVGLDVDVPAEGGAVASEMTVSEGGEYVLRVEGPDGRGARAVSSDLIWVSGGGGDAFASEDDAHMKLLSSKPRYSPGDVARLIPQVGLPGMLGLVTVERDGVLSHRVVPLAGEAIELGIEARFAPNVYVSVAGVRGRVTPEAAGPAAQADFDPGRPRFKLGMANLEVDPSARRLAVTVTTERSAYEPGETVKATVKVVGGDGKPVKTELAVAAADEGVLQILGFRTPDPLPAFYAPWGLGVDSATSWNRIVRRLDPALEVEGEEGGDAGGSEAGRVRSRFMATAFWQPALVTGADGTAQVSFVAPDNLTAFRLMAVGADGGDRFGSGEVRFSVKKSLQAVPALPRFLNVGDSLEAGLVLHNNTPGPLDVDVTMTATGVDRGAGDPQQKATVAAGATERLAFPVIARAAGQARFQFKASARGPEGPLQDAVEVTLPVQRPSVPETIVLGEGVAKGGVSLSLPAQSQPTAMVPNVGGLEVVLDRTGLSRLDEGLAYLVGYPYGCLEQLTSKVVPMVALGDLVKSTGGQDAQAAIAGVPAREVAGFVRAGVAKIAALQSDSGGFALWPGGAPELHYSAYALWGLGVASRAGVAVASEVMSSGTKYLKARLAEKPATGGSPGEIAGEAGSRAFAHAVLADQGAADAAGLRQVFETRAQLPVHGQAFLLTGLTKAGLTTEAKTLVGELAARAPKGDGPVLLEDPGDFDWYWSSNVRTTALTLLALLAAAPDHALVGRLADGLLGARRAGRWDNTQENVYSLLALAGVARRRAGAGDSTVKLSIAGKAQPAQVLRGAGVARLTYPLASIVAASDPIRLEVSGGAITYSVRLKVERPLGSAASDRGLAVRRTWFDADTGASIERARLGQAVRVRLQISAAGRQAHIALADLLPAGLEPILTRFSPPGAAEGLQPPSWGSRWQTSWEHQELRDDRALVFADVL
ncbi:MAG TPA: MG2 domain-containing protein, partial [Polyangia bacterium]